MSERTVHPGEIVKEELDRLGITPTEFARQIDVPANRVFEIIKGQRSISVDTAIRFGHWFGTEPRLWINLQTQFRLATADKKIVSEISKLPSHGSLSESSMAVPM